VFSPILKSGCDCIDNAAVWGHMKSFVYTDVSGLEIIHRVQARDLSHARVKLSALHGLDIPETDSRLMTHTDYCADRDCALEPMGLAPWQRRLTRQESRNQFPLA
jgi:hypothetical protein